jgi:hypothetical protein
MSFGLEKDTYEIEFKTTGSDKAADLAKAVEKEEQAIRSLTAAIAAHEKAAVADASKIEQMKKAVVSAGKAVEAAGGQSKAAGQTLMALGYAADDLQYGFRGISNNIQPILQSIPALAGFAGAISIGAIAAYQLYEHWDLVQGVLGTGIPQPALTGPELLAENLKKATDAMDELAKKTRLEWHELERLNKLRQEVKDLKAADAAQRNVDQALAAQSDAEKARGSGFARAVAESGGKDAFDQFKGALEDSKDAQGLVLNEATGKLGKPADVARDMFDAALKGDKIARDAIRKALPKGSRFADNIAQSSPEVAQIYEDLDEENGRDSERQKKDRWEEQFYEDLDEENGRDSERQKREAVEQARKVTGGTGLGGRVDEALVRSALSSGGAPGVATAQVADQIARELQARGMGAKDAKDAAGAIAQEHAARLGDDINDRLRKGPEMHGVQHIGASDFARSVEGAGAKDLGKIAGGIEDMKNQLATMIKNQEMGRRLGP